ncbi:phosphotransferase [Brachybacterium sp. MASK1Z-5]|uniref:Phosphotransferase n=1 Tax=Brachybacterium halotolerans TaxID=2795215 RepID=A0ABS1BD50_9MICO|nr:phosphotransferase [Brachybacterium halotolerans]MBK0332497.1 phosphotransferase [Brachybacterium halotolerans]
MDEPRSTDGPLPDGPTPGDGLDVESGDGPDIGSVAGPVGRLGATLGDGLAGLLDDALPSLAQWMVRQRWYPAKGAGAPRLSVRGAAVIASTGAANGAEREGVRADGAEPEDARTGRAQVLDVVVRAVADGAATDYQVPLVVRSGDDVEDPDAVIAVLDGRTDGDPASAPLSASFSGPGTRSGGLRIEDACRTDLGRRALMDLLTADRPLVGRGLALDPAPVPGRTGARVVATRLLSGEQSNSSMIFTLEDADPVILKLFRVLAAGENPDVVLQGALDRAGCTRIAPMIGSVRVRVGGEESAEASADESADALLAQSFLPDVEDAWRVALQQASGGVDFRAGARDLGAAVAEVHRLLASELPSAPAAPANRARVLAQMRARLDEVASQVPEVLPHRTALRGLIDAAADAAWPPLQRIHGDLHLGQVLADPSRGWVLLDFEGEPLRPLAERTLPDCPVRDVAGMLRSLDYAGGAVLHEHGVDASAWVAESSRAFLDGYLDAMGIAHEDASFLALLRAFEADKAVYEVLYEARNRPGWLPIPLGALARLSSR